MGFNLTDRRGGIHTSVGKNGPRMEMKQPAPRFDNKKLMTVSCLTRLIDRKLAGLLALRDSDSASD